MSAERLAANVKAIEEGERRKRKDSPAVARREKPGSWKKLVSG